MISQSARAAQRFAELLLELVDPSVAGSDLRLREQHLGFGLSLLHQDARKLGFLEPPPYGQLISMKLSNRHAEPGLAGPPGLALSKFLEVVPRFEGRSSVRTFLFGIMRRKAAEMRRGARRIEHDDAALARAPDGVDGESRLANAELGLVIDECIDQLPQKQRTAARLRFQQQQATEDIGERLGVSGNYLGLLIHRAREHLRDCVGRHGFLR